MISSYYFSLTGRDHKNAGLPCHDYSAIGEISSSWNIAVVADGVGSCKHAERPAVQSHRPTGNRLL